MCYTAGCLALVLLWLVCESQESTLTPLHYYSSINVSNCVSRTLTGQYVPCNFHINFTEKQTNKNNREKDYSEFGSRLEAGFDSERFRTSRAQARCHPELVELKWRTMNYKSELILITHIFAHLTFLSVDSNSSVFFVFKLCTSNILTLQRNKVTS